MTAWETIKREATKNERKGSVGEMAKINLATDIFVAILPFLQNQRDEEREFNDDTDVTVACMSRAFIKDLGIR